MVNLILKQSSWSNRLHNLMNTGIDRSYSDTMYILFTPYITNMANRTR